MTAGTEEFLVVVAGPAAGAVLPVGAGVTLGRSQLGGDPAIEPKHARVARAADGTLVLAALDGHEARVNGAPAAPGHPLSVGDTIELGGTTLEIASVDRGRSQLFLSDVLKLAAATAIAKRPSVHAPDPARFRAEFPVFERVSYLNAGTDGPVPRRAQDAAAARVQVVLEQGRSGAAHDGWIHETAAELRRRYAELMSSLPAEVALTRATGDGIALVVLGLELGPGDEILTTDEEHFAMMAPLSALQVRRGVDLRVVPFTEIAGEVGPRTRLVACSHVSWVTGRIVDAAALASLDVPVLLDGAQSLGAIPVDVRELACDFYAAPGQKWLCGPDGSGCLYVRGERIEELFPAWPSYMTLAVKGRTPGFVLHPDARRFDVGWLNGTLASWSLASLDVLADAGWEWVLERGPALAERFAEMLRERGLEVAPRDRSTLVSWRHANAADEVGRLLAERIVVRDVPGDDMLRASVGAWSTEEELARLADLTAATAR
jgi:selenocysteine lyase/cysteine desulfurase